MLNLDNIVSNKNENKDNNWPFRMSTVGPSGSGKSNTLLHLIQNLNETTPVDKIYLYAKDLTEPKYEFLINNRKNAGIKHFNDSTAFIEHSNDMDDVFTKIDNYNKKRKRKVLIVFNNMIADIMSSTKFQAIIKELSIVFITQSYFRTPKDARLVEKNYKTLHKKIQETSIL